jgi:hypothetical protein
MITEKQEARGALARDRGLGKTMSSICAAVIFSKSGEDGAVAELYPRNSDAKRYGRSGFATRKTV